MSRSSQATPDESIISEDSNLLYRETSSRCLYCDEFYENCYTCLTAELVVAFLFHPIYYISTLMQLNYRPIEAVNLKRSYLIIEFINWFISVPYFIIPYINYIVINDGILGLYRGFFPRVCSIICSCITYYVVAIDKLNYVDENMQSTEYHYTVKWEVIATSAAITVSYPFFVVSNRQMAEFIGKESKYNQSTLNSFYTIAKEEKILAWFSGLTPYLISEILKIILPCYIIFLIHVHIVRIRSLKPYFFIVVQSYICNLLSAFDLVSIVMSISGSKLKAASPPLMSPYSNWVVCFSDLLQNGQLYRGGELVGWSYIPWYSSHSRGSTGYKTLEDYTLVMWKVKIGFALLYFFLCN